MPILTKSFTVTATASQGVVSFNMDSSTDIVIAVGGNTDGSYIFKHKNGATWYYNYYNIATISSHIVPVRGLNSKVTFTVFYIKGSTDKP